MGQCLSFFFLQNEKNRRKRNLFNAACIAFQVQLKSECFKLIILQPNLNTRNIIPSDIFSLLCKTVGAEYSCCSAMDVNFSLTSSFICVYADRKKKKKKKTIEAFSFLKLWFCLCGVFAAHSCRNDHLLRVFRKQRSNRHWWRSQWADRVHYPVQPQRPSEFIICLMLNSGSIKTSLL